MNDEPTRLNKHLALVLGVSRREADDLIASGQITIDGTIAQLGSRVAPHAVIAVNGQLVTQTPGYRYVMLNKPPGYVCSRRSQGEIPTIYELLPADMAPLKPVGRLDKDSSGLLILTNDGDFAHRMTHPSFHKMKSYEVDLTTPLEPLHQQMIADFGVELEDGRSQLGLEKVTDDRIRWRVMMHEGRNRQIRRTFEALGYSVSRLHRISFGPYDLADLPSGSTKTITL